MKARVACISSCACPCSGPYYWLAVFQQHPAGSAGPGAWHCPVWSRPTPTHPADSSPRQQSPLGLGRLCFSAEACCESEAMIALLYLVLPALGSYVVLSTIFLRRPHLLHTPRAPAFPIRLAAHRGGSGERLENTMEAVRNSIAQRADLLEFDCQLTRDGVVVVSHDRNLSRQSGLNKDIDTLDFEELPLYKQELEIYFSPGHFAHGSDRHMISLEDVFQKFPRIPVCVEIKEKNEELIHKVSSLAKRYNRTEITIWVSEKSSIMKRCKAANPEMPTSFTIWRSFWILVLYYLGLLPFVSIPEKFFFSPLPTIINRTYFPFSCRCLNKLSAVVLKWIIMRRSLIRYLQARGVQVLFWCLNEESDFEVAFSLGVDGVMTDFPTALRQYLDKQELKVPPSSV
ncbi:lysophospholipase D GDPD3 [Acomys russatus]|uniref:lysophospholipase D GDPD3 n=1 Tax=Acomys russatus TaxID=60746 RepID=UPI0021E226E3|nr:lysophospholipase D GDPD3 [Acomys russatus]